jgi:hypothetical protein
VSGFDANCRTKVLISANLEWLHVEQSCNARRGRSRAWFPHPTSRPGVIRCPLPDRKPTAVQHHTLDSSVAQNAADQLDEIHVIGLCASLLPSPTKLGKSGAKAVYRSAPS